MHRAVRSAPAGRRPVAGRNGLVAEVAGGTTRGLHRHPESVTGSAAGGELLPAGSGARDFCCRLTQPLATWMAIMTA